MATTTFTVPEGLLPQVDNIIKEFGFNTKEEFFQEAIRDKVLELRKKLFFKGSEEIVKKLTKKGFTEREILEEFNKQKHQ